MGNDNSPQHSPNKFSQPHRILSNTRANRDVEIPNYKKPKIIQNLSKLSKTLSNSKIILNFITKTENMIFLKNMNDSLNIGLNQLNLIIDNDINNPFLENNLKHIQIVDDSIDKKILGKLNYQSKEYNQKQMDTLIKNLIGIHNNIGNNVNVDNISRIYNKKNYKDCSREESQNSRKDEDLDLTSFSTTVGGKISSAASNYNKNQASKQIKTFKLKKKDDFIIEGNSNNNIFNYQNGSSRQDSPNSTNSFNTISNVLSSINVTHCHSKNSSNTSLKEKKLSDNNNRNNSNNNRNNLNNNRNNSNDKNINNNRNIIIKEHSPNNKIKINNFTKNINNKAISKKIVKKKLLPKKVLSGPQDNKKSPRRKNITIDINTTDINNISNLEYNSFLDNNIYINNTISGIDDHNIKRGIPIKNFNLEINNKPKSPTSILNNKILNDNLRESEQSQIIFNNVRPLTQRHNYSYSNNNSSMINNLSSINKNYKINNTNIIKEDKFFKYLEENSNSSILKTEPNLEYNSKIKISENKNKKSNKNKNVNNNPSNKNNKIHNKNNNKDGNQTYGNIINKEKNRELNTASILTNNKNLKENKEIEINDNKKNITKKILKKGENNFNTENIIENKINITKNIANKNKLNIKKINTKTLDNHKILKMVKNNNIKGNISPNKKMQETKKVNYLDTEPYNSSFKNQEKLKKTSLEEISNKILKPQKKIFNEKHIIENKNTKNNYINNFNNKKNNINKDQNNINKGQNNINKEQNIINKQKKKIIKKTRKQKNQNVVYNIDLTDNTNDEDNKENISNDNQSKSEDISDNSISHDENIHINNLDKKIGKSFKDKNNIINNKKKINNIDNNINYDINKNKFLIKNIDINSENDFISLDTNNNNELKINYIKKNNNKKIPKLKKEANSPNSKINKLVFDLKEINRDNYSDDNLDDEVCNFSGINNKSYTNKIEYEYNSDIFNDPFNEDFKRSKSPCNIFHKKMDFKFDNKNNLNKNPKNDEYEYNNNIFENLQINNLKIEKEKKNNNNNDDIKNNEIKDIKNINNFYNKEKNHKNIQNISNDNFSFKFKINKPTDSKNTFSKMDNENKNIKSDSVFESKESSKFNFKINDDIHDSEFNDIDFLD